MQIISIPKSSFLYSMQSDYAICVIESQGSFMHEVINLAIVESMLNANKMVVLVGSRSFISHMQNSLVEWSNPGLDRNLKFVSLDSPNNLWGPTQLLFELRALRVSSGCTRVFFLSISPYTQIAVAIYNLGRFFRLKSFKNVSAVAHGFLANLLPRKERPDPYLYRRSKWFRLHPLRFLLQPKFTLPLNNFRFTSIDYMVLSKHILDDSLLHKRHSNHFRVIEPPVKSFINSFRQLKEPSIVRILCLGRMSPYDFKMLLNFLPHYRKSNFVLLVNARMQSVVDIGDCGYIKYVHLDERRQIVEAAKEVDILLMVRSKDESRLRLSGVPLEALALCRPIILPLWFSKLGASINEKIVYKSYSNFQELANLLSDQHKLYEIVGGQTL